MMYSDEYYALVKVLIDDLADVNRAVFFIKCFNLESMFFKLLFVFVKQRTSYDMRIGDWCSDVCSSDLTGFKVPSFAQLFRASAETQYTNLDLADPAICPGGIYNPQVAGCDVQIQPDILIGGNAALEPEESKQKSFGVVIAPTEYF